MMGVPLIVTLMMVGNALEALPLKETHALRSVVMARTMEAILVTMATLAMEMDVPAHVRLKPIGNVLEVLQAKRTLVQTFVGMTEFQ